MSKLKDLAKQVIGDGKSYIALNEIIKNYAGVVTIDGAYYRVVSNDGEVVPCFTFSEDANKFFYAVSGDLSKLFEKWLEAYESVEELDEDLKSGPVKVKLEKVRTKNGMTYTKVQLLEI